MNTTENSDQPYTDNSFTHIRAGSYQSAREAVPLVLGWNRCTSVVDVGCGSGTFLCVLKEHGVTDVLGLDGDHVNRIQLQIAESEFRSADLTAPPPLGRTFDLAVSLEVAEHLLAEATDRFVEYLTSLAPLVLFSAATPGQGGTKHLNEQWPEYWAERFQKQGFVTIDCLRGRLWRNEKGKGLSTQNMLLFASQGYLATNPDLQEMAARTDINRLALVHPRPDAIAKRQIDDLQRQREVQRTGSIQALPNPVRSSSGLAQTKRTWTSEGAAIIEVRVGTPDGPLLARSESDGSPLTGPWVSDGTAFFLQDASRASALSTESTPASVVVRQWK